MVELVGDGAGEVPQGDEVEDVMVLVQVVLDLDGRPVVVAVDPLALVAREGDEVARAEDEVVLVDADLVALGGHGGSSSAATRHRARPMRRGPDQPEGPAGIGRGIVPSRRAANKAAVTRSAVAPGLREWPSARSQRSKSSRSGDPRRGVGPAEGQDLGRSPRGLVRLGGASLAGDQRVGMARQQGEGRGDDGRLERPPLAERRSQGGERHPKDLEVSVGVLPGDQVAVGRQPHRFEQRHGRLARHVLRVDHAQAPRPGQPDRPVDPSGVVHAWSPGGPGGRRSASGSPSGDAGQGGEQEDHAEVRVRRDQPPGRLDRPEHGLADAEVPDAIERTGDRRGAQHEVEVGDVVEVAEAMDVPRLPRRDLQQAGDLRELSRRERVAVGVIAGRPSSRPGSPRRRRSRSRPRGPASRGRR